MSDWRPHCFHSGESAMFLITRLKFNALQLVRRCKICAFVVYQSNGLSQLVLERVYRIAEFHFLIQAITSSYCRW